LTPKQNKKGRVLPKRTQEKQNVQKTELDKWANESIPLLKKHGYLETETTQGSRSWLMPGVFFILGILFCGIFIYAINNDAFKSEFNQEIDPNVSVNVENQYDFAPTTENEYEMISNHTIINNIIIPSDLCGVSPEGSS